MIKAGQKNRDRSKPGRSGPDQVSRKWGVGQSQSRSRADQAHDKEEARQGKRGQDREGKARWGHDRIMPKDMTELDKVGQVSTK